MPKKPDVALIVHSCDRYQLLYQGFEYFFKEFWDFSIDCKYYFATEELDVEIPGFTNIKSGKGEWSDRLSYLLREQVQEKYVLYLQEDVWFNQKICKGFFTKLFEAAELNKWKQVKLHSADIYKTTKTSSYIEGLNVALLNNSASRYLMSHQITLWERKFFIEQLTANENPWRNERRGTKRLKKNNPDILHIDYFAQNHSKPINENLENVERANFHTISVNGMLNEEVLPFIDHLSKGDDLAQEYAEKLIYHYINGLTHDGRERPRKQDIFKKMKNWLFQ
ncbi:hypothetical protein [Dyadobacter sp. CY323]|uniref:hypothetical protein n=1 Tax=Dyadobacter sp. CY323 TaxID=2907302 RepID=UPI001F34BC75|nr:hypothetical protein [Dyadobacter sp. CY323]MCE6991142.1 hypothetical protein [Dyadobacter sp. CY323]